MINEDQKKWVKDNYIKWNQLTAEEKINFLSEVKKISNLKYSYDSSEQELKNTKALCDLVGFKVPESIK